MLPSNYSIHYETEESLVSPVHQVLVPQELSSNRDCLVSPTDGSPVPHSVLLTAPFTCAAIE